MTAAALTALHRCGCPYWVHRRSVGGVLWLYTRHRGFHDPHVPHDAYWPVP